MPLPIVAIIGSPNVGKSTLFNRLLKKRVAVVDDRPGVTRDRNYAPCTWNGKNFYLVDTGGLIPSTRNELEIQVKVQSESAIAEADLILFLIDNKIGPQEIDLEIARRLRKANKKVLLVANKVDNQKEEQEIYTLSRLGLGEPYPVSAVNGRNATELLEEISRNIPEVMPEEEKGIKVAVIGRANVGKSTYVNALLGEEKLVVSQTPGTTRDAIDTKIKIKGDDFILIDTAGLRKRVKIKDQLEYYTSLRTIRSIQRADVCLLLTEAPFGMVTQDLKIAGEVMDMWKGLVIGVNKWDMIQKESKSADYYTRWIKSYAPFLEFVPIIFISSKSGQRVEKTIELVKDVYNERGKRIPTNELNSVMEEEIRRQPPSAVKGKYIKIYYCTQTGIEPPSFVFFSNYPDLIKKPYLKYLHNKIREHFGFTGCPIRIKVNKRE
ncbi:MAG: ribosome biogenesis GTPase Der [candidate division Zixibacteria bacterium]|nr:ribosome biogenesis GTPase Der [candidate division Zixibacteria bacterium]